MDEKKEMASFHPSSFGSVWIHPISKPIPIHLRKRFRLKNAISWSSSALMPMYFHFSCIEIFCVTLVHVSKLPGSSLFESFDINTIMWIVSSNDFKIPERDEYLHKARGLLRGLLCMCIAYHHQYTGLYEIIYMVCMETWNRIQFITPHLKNSNYNIFA